ncbi:MAG TPA: hypothetical protein VMA86_02405, partial [Acetobacteraceae bacterium]|nr:hypothetical protein [Acetobacteraceae bacterium]
MMLPTGPAAFCSIPGEISTASPSIGTRAPRFDLTRAEKGLRLNGMEAGMARDGIFMSVDEYAYTGAPANLKLALAYAMVLNEMLRHTDFIRMSAFTMGIPYPETEGSEMTTRILGSTFIAAMQSGVLVLLATVTAVPVALAQMQTEVPPAVPGARPVTVEHIKVHSEAIAGNLEGESANRDVIVFLPPGYDVDKSRRYPVVYALHGFFIGAEQWT